MIQKFAGSYYKYYRLAYTITAACLLVTLIVYQYGGSSYKLFKTNIFIQFIAVVMVLFGLYAMAVSIKKYFFQLSGIQVLLKSSKTNKPQTRGPNAYVRHPLYAGTILTLWSLFILFPFLNNLIACAIITIYTFIGIRLEEKKLAIQYGERYVNYRDKTPMIIPTFKKSPANSNISA